MNAKTEQDISLVSYDSTLPQSIARARRLAQEKLAIIASPPPPAPEFTWFDKLPAELRNMIWELAIDASYHSLMALNRLCIPPLMHACHDSRSLLLPSMKFAYYPLMSTRSEWLLWRDLKDMKKPLRSDFPGQRWTWYESFRMPKDDDELCSRKMDLERRT